MRPSKLTQSKPKIAARIQGAGARVYRIRELGTLLDELRAKDLVAKRLSVDDFIEFLESEGILRTANIKRALGGSLVRYYHGELSPYETWTLDSRKVLFIAWKCRVLAWP